MLPPAPRAQLSIKRLSLQSIYSGQLYRLIEKLKTPADAHKAEQLKKPLMSAILGEGNFHIIKHGERDYYCATRESWEAAGIIPRIRG
jgi:hypothetical protein